MDIRDLEPHPLLDHLDAVQASEPVLRRIRMALGVVTDDVLAWCLEQIADPESLTKTTDCWHVRWDGAMLSVRLEDLQICSVRREKSKKVSDLSDVNLDRSLDDLQEEKAALVAVFDRKTHRRISRYGVQLAEHVLEMADVSMEGLLEICCAVNRRWQDGDAHFQEARDVAFRIHEQARNEPEQGFPLMLVTAESVINPDMKLDLC